MVAEFPYRTQLAMPVIGLESEFQVYVDEQVVVPEEYWRAPSAFIDRPLLYRSSKASQLPTGGAVYFDGGVLEVVTPVIELGSQSTARVVRSLWEQIGFIRGQLDRWQQRHGKRVRLQAYSCHFNISYELARGERNRNRTIQKLALLLAHLLPAAVLVAGTNRRSTGLGVRPRRDRIEITLDFIPDPGLMAATTALIVGIVREVIGWPSYRVEELAARGIPAIADVEPGKHATRNGWVARDFHFPHNPFTTSADARVWTTIDGRTLSLRDIALETASAFRDSIQRYADAFSVRLLFAVLRGEMPSLLDLDDRPPAYDDIGHVARWGEALPELANYSGAMRDEEDAAPLRRRADVEEKLAPPWRGEGVDRRHRVQMPPRVERRDKNERRTERASTTSPRLARSAYERVFRQLASGKRLRVGREVLTPVGVRGWYHAIFENASGDERILSIDQVLEHMDQWRE
ncbi:MAG: hypothetical protein JO197_21155 [Acidobacteria bacterium]|nr:hypothetical protein [Acidobacteriota bacterium]MBV9476882.1 hypothetical protein [Acidobacteriota bacterium]